VTCDSTWRSPLEVGLEVGLCTHQFVGSREPEVREIVGVYLANDQYVMVITFSMSFVPNAGTEA
jgi:hypothetical protein